MLFWFVLPFVASSSDGASCCVWFNTHLTIKQLKVDWKIYVADTATNMSSSKWSLNDFLCYAEIVGWRHLGERQGQPTVISRHESDLPFMHFNIYCRDSVFHSQLCSSDNYSCNLNKLHSNVWTLPCFLLVCLVKLPCNCPSRVQSYKQTLTANVCLVQISPWRRAFVFWRSRDTLQSTSAQRWAHTKNSKHELPCSKTWLEKGSKHKHDMQGLFLLECMINFTVLIHIGIKLLHTFVIKLLWTA